MILWLLQHPFVLSQITEIFKQKLHGGKTREKNGKDPCPPLTSSSHICPYSLEKYSNYPHNLSWLRVESSPSLPLHFLRECRLSTSQRLPGIRVRIMYGTEVAKVPSQPSKSLSIVEEIRHRQKQVLLEKEWHLSPGRGPDGAGDAGDQEITPLSARARHRATGYTNHSAQRGLQEEGPLEKGPRQRLLLVVVAVLVG